MRKADRPRSWEPVETLPVAPAGGAEGILRPLEVGDLRATSNYLERRPDRDLYLRALVRQQGVELPEAWGTLVGWFARGTLEGVFLHSSVLLLSCDDPIGTVAFGQRVARMVREVPPTQLIAPRAMARTFRRVLEDHGVGDLETRFVRDLMHSMRLSRQGLVPLDRVSRRSQGERCSLRRAQRRDRELVRVACRQVTREELGIDPEEFDREAFNAALDHRIRVGREYLWEEDGRLVFRASLAAVTPDSVLVEGVYVPLERRGMGIGSLGMHTLCNGLLRRYSRLLLLVGAENHRARSLYQRLGFQDHWDFQAAYFSSPPPPASTEVQGRGSL